MSALATHIGDSGHGFRHQFALQVQMPLLYIGPDSLLGNGRDIDGEIERAISGIVALADALVSQDFKLCSRQY